VATKLTVYNRALLALKSRRLTGLTENRSERRDLDAVYSETLDWMLERALWNFSLATEEWTPSAEAESQFGYQYAYDKPDYYSRLVRISANERFVPTLSDFSEEGDFFFSDVSPMWVQYVSTDPERGRDAGKWPPAFAEAFALELAWRAGPHICSMSAQDMDGLKKNKKEALYQAKTSDAVNQPMATLPPGRLVQARTGRRNSYNNMRRTPYA
jgi:hypothetical protein